MPLSAVYARFRSRRRGFTAIELLVIFVILLLLLSIFIPFIRKTRETDHRVRCQSNLRAIGQALSKYAKSNGGTYPRVVADAAGTNFPGYFAYTGPYADNPFAGDGRVSANDVTASLFLLIRQGYATPDLFVCPSTGDVPDPLTGPDAKFAPPESRSNFKRARNLSYSYANPFGRAPGYRLDEYRDAVFVLMADRNPGKADQSDVTAPPFDAKALDMARANSTNHRRAGQSVLYADIHVEFRSSPYAGVGGDNIYTALSPTPLPEQPQPNLTANGVLGREFSPAWKFDSYLVPVEGEDRP
ncbi:MAG TPA: prepilin-type N-terminal cleavage/methylation domain-containing protein [Tepidisphaeraceae bacterium]|nr:prepilin-type N-terminal cleavage/methylation domain-containing protein [Tepidisphaeraceae bacterium]